MQSTPRLIPSSGPPDNDLTQPTSQTHRVWRVWVVVGGLSILLLALVLQLLRFQIFPPESTAENAAVVAVADTRGAVVDRNGDPLVVNSHFFQLTATPANITTDAGRQEVAMQLQDTIGLDYGQVYANLTAYAGQPWTVLADAISLEDARKITDLQATLAMSRTTFPLRAVLPIPLTRRYYPQAEMTAHILGFVHPERGAVFGIEQYYNGFLVRDGAGLLSQKTVPIQQLSPDFTRFIPSAVGKDLILTLDSTIQWIIRDELRKGLEEFRAVSGSVLVMDPHTGAIYGMVNLPDYDPNRYEAVTQEQYSSFPNSSISAQYEPGSVFKIVTLAAALDAGKIRPTTLFTDTGSYTIGGRVIFNSTRTANGVVDATQALALSLNVVTAQIAQELGADEFYRYVRLFGFGSASNIDLAGEVTGQIKTPRDPDWSLADLGTNSFGQGLASTPLQMLNATAVIANGGKLLQPYLVEARVAGDQVQFTEPVVVRQVLKPESAHDMAMMMAEVISTSGSKAGVPGYAVAGKSGTAQIPTKEGYVSQETIVSYVGFAPADDPKFVMLVKLDRPDPTLNVWAGQTAGPVFGRIAQRLLDYFSVPPDEIRLAASQDAGN
jgi:cell division protein FtsI/penicillin-binding protein 2